MLRELALKEVKVTLRDKKLIISSIVIPLAMFILLGFVMRFTTTTVVQQAGEAVKTLTVYVCDLDRGEFSSLVLQITNEIAKEFQVVHECGEGDLVNAVASGVYSVAVMIPQNASKLFNEMKTVKLLVVGRALGASLSSSVTGQAIVNFFSSAVSSSIKYYVAITRNIDPNFIFNPVETSSKVLFRGVLVDPQVLGSLMTLAFSIAFVPLILVSSGLSYASTSMSSENEEKTLEMLLSLPVSRFTILLSKMIGSMVLVILSAVSFIVGFTYYVFSAFSFAEVPGAITSTRVSLTPQISLLATFLSPTSITLVGVGVLISLIASSALGLLIGSISPDVRTAGTYAGPFTLVFFVPGLMLAYLDITSLGVFGLALALCLSPFIAPLIVIKGFIEGIEWLPYVSLVTGVIAILALLYIASKLLNSERVLTMQARITLKKLKKKTT